MTSKFNFDGTVTYWSVNRQEWHEQANPVEIADSDLATMSCAEAARIIAMPSATPGLYSNRKEETQKRHDAD